MEFKKLMTTAMMFGAITFSAQNASARPGYETTVGSVLGTTGFSCNACHVGTTSASTATTPLALTWRAGRNLATTDSDGDGFTNIQEVSGAALNFNNPFTTPYTLAGGNPLNNVLVTGDPSAVEKPFSAASGGIIVPVTNEILGNISVDIYATPSSITPVTLLFKAGGTALTSKVYAVDTYTQTNIPLAATTEWTTTANGGVQITLLPNGVATPATIVVERVIPVVPAAGTTTYGGEDGEEGEACMTTSSTTPLMMVITLLLLGMYIRKKD